MQFFISAFLYFGLASHNDTDCTINRANRRQMQTMKNKLETLSSGVIYTSKSQVLQSDINEPYYFLTYSGKHQFNLEQGDCCFYLSEDKSTAICQRGPAKIKSLHFACIVRGYSPPNKSCEISSTTNLPYINGCSTRQIFAPERPGDPTWQLLKMPKNVSEQKHHIHPTARVVYIYKGSGYSIVGTKNKFKKTKLDEGMVCALSSMTPHHFETTSEELIVLPVHIWSTVGNLDLNHPMYNGTLEV